jgi:NTE family protein
MNVQLNPHVTVAERGLPFECVVLVLQGGGALGAYQAGVYEALAEARIYPNWIAGISIGAINGALIGGNAPEARVLGRHHRRSVVALRRVVECTEGRRSAVVAE